MDIHDDDCIDWPANEEWAVIYVGHWIHTWEIAKWKWFLMNGCECTRLISTTMKKIFKRVSRGVTYINVLRDYVEKQWYLSEINDMH